jgi:hypothetical protein
MAEVIPFPLHLRQVEADPEIDLMTAVDVAIRDLREIARTMDLTMSRMRAEETRLLLERAYEAAREASA